ncbi:phage holin family protein [Bradyrhizobium lablabi]|uniref:phage holin family protein n=1 Tax=Bradyrhizobium lablabi TaxID=722472 RepID=UPI001BABF0A2|nr:phage holin family protein [Bradyrhizobium lablabi]MBR1126258.1 phage holin family protein [Bradyrhizobium lablabi]
MLAPSGGLLRAGIGLKLNHIKRATRSYLRDRANQATGSVTSYAVAAGLFAAAGIFLIAACLVGVTALFRWIEINYGLFHAFGVVGALLLVIAAVCAGLAMRKLKQPGPQFPSLTSRLRVAIRANPIDLSPAEAVQDVAASVLAATSSPVSRSRSARGSRHGKNNFPLQAGVALTAVLLGVAMARRRQAMHHTAE